MENCYVQEYAEIHGKSLLNVRVLKNKKAEYTVIIENKEELEKRIAKLEKKIVVKDEPKRSKFTIDCFVDGKRISTDARYGKKPKDEALKQINDKRQEIIKKLTIYFE